FLADPLRLQGMFTSKKWLQHFERSPHKLVVREYASQATQTFIGVHHHQRVDAIFREQFVAPATLWSRSAQSRATKFTDSHRLLVAEISRQKNENCKQPCAKC